MHLIRIAAAALNQVPMAWEHNRQNILQAIADARNAGITLLCLPELSITGYGCEDAFHSYGVMDRAFASLESIEPYTEGMIVALGLPVVHRGAVYNAAALIVDGSLAGMVAKRFLAGDGIHYEPRWFRPWPEGKLATFRHAGRSLPLGDQVFDVGGLRIGFEICEDAWVPNRPGGSLASAGADILLNLSASHFAFGRHGIRRRFVLEGSRAFGTTYVYANLLGNEAGRVIYGGDTLIATRGTLLASGPRFGFAPVYLTTAVMDLSANRMKHARTTSFTPAVDDAARAVLNREFTFPRAEPTTQVTPPHAPIFGSEHEKFEEFTRASALGLFDYLRKSRMRGFVVSLSGGADSAAVACLVYLSIRLASVELGLAKVADILGYPQDIAFDQLMDSLLACVYQPTRNSSQTTRDAAHGLATALGAAFFTFDVDDVVQQYIGMVGKALQRDITWETDDIALQNIQARARAPGVWMLANIRRALLLATSNRSEASVGYATMDGDTCGGLSPIAGIDKAFLLAWLRWLETTGPIGVGPIPALTAINVQQPTAELRPPEAEQTDEGDLMPYPILDRIERAAVRDKLPPRDCYQCLRAEYPDHPEATLLHYIERFFGLWSRNQWKRERYAPSFHLDDENVDPKTWCRFPILSGAYREELAQLRAEVLGEQPAS